MARIRVLQQAALIRHSNFLARNSLRPWSQAPLLKLGANLSTSSRLRKYSFPEIPPEDESFIIKSPYSDVEIPETNLADFVWRDVEKWPERTALVNYRKT